MKRFLSAFSICAFAGLVVVTGCAKSTSDQSAGASATTGPVTDSASTGMKAPSSGTQVALGNATHGQAIFTQNCSSCHGVGGKGGGIGPSLKGEKGRKNYAAAVAWIKNPQPPMPKLYPSPLSETDVADAAAYVESL